MKRILKIIGLVVALLLVIGAVIFFFFPGTIVDLTNSQNASAAGLVKKEIALDGYNVNYFISEQKDETKDDLMLLHGMGDDKNSFVLAAKELSKHYNLILPDLSGHGENERTEDRDYSIKGQVDFVYAFVKALNVNSFHLAGNSMGGHTAAAYSIEHPEHVKTLTLVNAAGVKLDDHVVYGGFGAPLKSKEDLVAIFDRVFYKTPDIPGPIANHMIEQVNGSIDFVNNTLVTSIKNGEYFNLKGKTQNIIAPTLILWGKHDEVVKFNVAEYYDQTIPMSELQLLENGSHSPQLEIPEDVGNAIHNFIQKPKNDLMASTKNDHAAKTQYYRWYLFYERDFENSKRLANQLDILDENIKMKSAAGEMEGRKNYPERLKVYKGWKNAHHVKNIDVNTMDDGTINLEADIVYQNIKPDNSQTSYSLHYSTFLEPTDKMLPVFTEINIQPTGNIENPTFEDAYPTNRLKSLMHYWLLNIEQLDGNATPFEEILASDFELNFSSGKITTIDAFEKWLKGTPSQLKMSNHYPENFSVKELGDNQYEMKVEFVWRGLAKDGKALKTKTSHTWLVVDNTEERFARVKRVDVEVIEAFQLL
ncbi:MAG: alpha/beta hydrolase [Bacteroidota bacterium]